MAKVSKQTVDVETNVGGCQFCKEDIIVLARTEVVPDPDLNWKNIEQISMVGKVVGVQIRHSCGVFQTGNPRGDNEYEIHVNVNNPAPASLPKGRPYRSIDPEAGIQKTRIQ